MTFKTSDIKVLQSMIKQAIIDGIQFESFDLGSGEFLIKYTGGY